MRNYFCQYRYRNLNACKFHLERHVEYSTGPTVDKTNVTLVRSNDFSRAGNTFPWTSASLKITLMESTYPGQRPQSPSLSPHFLLLRVISTRCCTPAGFKLTKLLGIDDFSAAKDFGKVFIIIIYCFYNCIRRRRTHPNREKLLLSWTIRRCQFGPPRKFFRGE